MESSVDGHHTIRTIPSTGHSKFYGGVLYSQLYRVHELGATMTSPMTNGTFPQRALKRP